MKSTAKSNGAHTKTTTTRIDGPIRLRPAAAEEPTKPEEKPAETLEIDRAEYLSPMAVTGTCDDVGGDIISHLLDELSAMLGAAQMIAAAGGEDIPYDLIAMSWRKVEAARSIYACGLHLPDEKAGAA